MDAFENYMNEDDPNLGEVFELDENTNAELVTITDSNRDALVELALYNFASRFIGCSCRYCGKVYETLQDVNDAPIYDGQQPMHESCWNRYKVEIGFDDGNKSE